MNRCSGLHVIVCFYFFLFQSALSAPFPLCVLSAFNAKQTLMEAGCCLAPHEINKISTVLSAYIFKYRFPIVWGYSLHGKGGSADRYKRLQILLTFPNLTYPNLTYPNIIL